MGLHFQQQDKNQLQSIGLINKCVSNSSKTQVIKFSG